MWVCWMIKFHRAFGSVWKTHCSFKTSSKRPETRSFFYHWVSSPRLKYKEKHTGVSESHYQVRRCGRGVQRVQVKFKVERKEKKLQNAAPRNRPLNSFSSRCSDGAGILAVSTSSRGPELSGDTGRPHCGSPGLG